MQEISSGISVLSCDEGFALEEIGCRGRISVMLGTHSEGRQIIRLSPLDYNLLNLRLYNVWDARNVINIHLDESKWKVIS